MKKLLLVAFMIAMLVCLFAISVSAAEIPEWGEVLRFETGDKAIEYKEGFDKTSRVLLDNGDGTYSTYPTNYIIVGSDTVFTNVKELDFSALKTATGKEYSYDSVVRLEIPVGYTKIDQYALRDVSTKGNFTSMLTVKVPEGVTEFGNHVGYQTSTLQEITIPSTLVTWGTDPFRESSSLTTVDLTGVTVVGLQAFYKTSTLTTVIGNGSLTTICKSAFNRTSLENTDPAVFMNVETIETYGFYSCKISELSFPNLKTVGQEAVAYCSNLEKLAIGGGKDTGTSAFCQNTALTTLTIGAGFVTNYPEKAFSGTKNIVTVYYTGLNASDLTNIVNVGTKTIVAGVNHCVAFYDGEHHVSNPVYNFVSFIEGATITGSCSRTACGLEASKTEVAPIFSGFMYSARENEDNVFGLVMFYSVNQKSIETYKKYTSKSLSYGVMAIAKKNVTNGESISNPLNADGTTAYQKIIATEIGQAVSSVTMIIKGSGEAWEKEKATEFFITGYVTDGEALQYFTSSINANLSAISTISYSQC